MRPIVVTVVMAAAALGCGGLLKRPEIHHYALTPAAAGATRVQVAGLPLGISVVELPPGLDRQDVVVRTSAERFEVRGHELWAAPLGTVVLHRLAFDLAARLPAGMVILPGQVQPAGGTRTLDLAFEDLAAGPDPVLVLDVRWTLRPSEPRTSVLPRSVAPTSVAGPAELAGHERIAEPLDSLDSASIAAGTSRALAMLADRLAAALAGA